MDLARQWRHMADGWTNVFGNSAQCGDDPAQCPKEGRRPGRQGLKEGTTSGVRSLTGVRMHRPPRCCSCMRHVRCGGFAPAVLDDLPQRTGRLPSPSSAGLFLRLAGMEACCRMGQRGQGRPGNANSRLG